MASDSGVDPAAPRAAQAARVASGLMLAGAALGLVTAVTPPATQGSETLALAVPALAAVIAVLLLGLRRPVGEATVGVITLLGTLLITIGTDAGGGPGSGTADNEMLYVWVCLFSFYFLSLPHALGQLAVVGGAYAWLLTGQETATSDAATRWLVTIATLLIAGLLVTRLRGGLDRLVAELSERIRRDSLTGLLNRHGLEQRGEVELARMRRDGTPVGMIVADLDQLKEVNDSHGHPAGDRILRRVATALAAETREIDAVARVGGDEFAILLPGAGEAAARRAAERLLAAVEASSAGDALPLNLSIGVAAAPGAGATLEEVWQAADRAMYEAKRAGGAAVVAAGTTGDPLATVSRIA